MDKHAMRIFHNTLQAYFMKNAHFSNRISVLPQKKRH